MRVWTFGYDSAWFGVDSVNTSLTGISKRLLSALEREVSIPWEYCYGSHGWRLMPEDNRNLQNNPLYSLLTVLVAWLCSRYPGIFVKIESH